ncbi:hypothetical protein JHK86_036063 [Glycine max]|nr:hypothetical protein JHK86_036063 [Glycine max]
MPRKPKGSSARFVHGGPGLWNKGVSRTYTERLEIGQKQNTLINEILNHLSQTKKKILKTIM